MAILVGRETRVICQGLTGRAAIFHVRRMQSYGTRIVGGVTPGKGGRRHLDLPVFDTVAEAVAATGANASLVFVPPDNRRGLASAMQRLIADPEERHRLGRRALLRARQFTLDRMADEYARAYALLTAERGPEVRDG